MGTVGGEDEVGTCFPARRSDGHAVGDSDNPDGHASCAAPRQEGPAMGGSVSSGAGGSATGGSKAGGSPTDGTGTSACCDAM